MNAETGSAAELPCPIHPSFIVALLVYILMGLFESTADSILLEQCCYITILMVISPAGDAAREVRKELLEE